MNPTARMLWLATVGAPQSDLLKGDETMSPQAESPVTIQLGARQTGKTPLAHMVAKHRDQVRFFDLEVAADRITLANTPERVLSELTGLVVLDEVQRMPALFEILRASATGTPGSGQRSGARNRT